MISLEYGKIFRQIREQKYLSLSYFQKVGIPRSNLSKFERGESMMAFDRVVLALQAMDVSLAEYELMINHFVSDFQEHFFEELEKAKIAQNIEKLRRLHEEAKGIGNKLYIIAAKAEIFGLSSIEAKIVSDYLREVKFWGYFELSLCYVALDYLETVDILSFLESFNQNNSNHYELFKYRRKIYQITFSALLNLSSRGEKNGVLQIIKLTPPIKEGGIDFYLSVFKILASGFTKYCFDNEKDGIDEIQQALDFLEVLGNQQLRIYYENRIKNFLNK